jgi:nitrogen fixation protein NifB
MPSSCNLVGIHPCFNRSAKSTWGRVHLPVAPNCNIQCNYCSRLFDCVHESRPGVTKRILEPVQAEAYLDGVLQAHPRISVIGIAGSGDPLCEPDITMETSLWVHRKHPQMLLCLSTNGLNAPDHVETLARLRVSHVTVTVNAIDPEVGQKICCWVKFQDNVLVGRDAATLLWKQQETAIRLLKAKGIIVKVNTVLIPRFNLHEVTRIAKIASTMNVDLMNCIPLIPVAGTPFENLEDLPQGDINEIRHSAGRFIPQMTHCVRCGADASGLLEQVSGHVQAKAFPDRRDAVSDPAMESMQRRCATSYLRKGATR